MRTKILKILCLIIASIILCSCNIENNSINHEKIIEDALEKCDDRTETGVLDKKVVKRFLTYVSFDTHSIPESDTFPSNPDEKELGKYLSEELKGIGLSNVESDSLGYLYATLPASEGSENKPVLAFICHMDVSSDAPSADIHTVITTENGKNMIRTDGKTLLGADDKSGISEVVTAIEELVAHPEYSHPEIRIVVTPDEEIGCGTERIDLNKINATYAYTVDGDAIGEISYETFNAANAKLKFNGVSMHPGDAYGKMKNAVNMLADFISMIPENEQPGTTKDRDGYYHINNISEGNVEHTEASLILRDFEKDGLKARKEFILSVCDKINEKYGEGSCEIEIEDIYPNMKEYIIPEYEFLIQYAREAYTENGIEPFSLCARGGTDGSSLSSMGLPTPNLGTGMADCHSVNEYIAVEDLESMVNVIISLVSKFA